MPTSFKYSRERKRHPSKNLVSIDFHRQNVMKGEEDEFKFSHILIKYDCVITGEDTRLESVKHLPYAGCFILENYKLL